MSGPIKDGGPAFPRPASVHERRSFPESARCEQDGMTLRDWFAGQALMGMLADTRNVDSCESNATAAYRFADAMLKARDAK